MGSGGRALESAGDTGEAQQSFRATTNGAPLEAWVRGSSRAHLCPGLGTSLCSPVHGADAIPVPGMVLSVTHSASVMTADQ